MIFQWMMYHYGIVSFLRPVNSSILLVSSAFKASSISVFGCFLNPIYRMFGWKIARVGVPMMCVVVWFRILDIFVLVGRNAWRK